MSEIIEKLDQIFSFLSQLEERICSLADRVEELHDKKRERVKLQKTKNLEKALFLKLWTSWVSAGSIPFLGPKWPVEPIDSVEFYKFLKELFFPRCPPNILGRIFRAVAGEILEVRPRGGNRHRFLRIPPLAECRERLKRGGVDATNGAGAEEGDGTWS